MSIALIFTKNDPLPWRDRLLKKLPGVTIECHPDVKDKDAVRFALCWKPEPGVFEQYKNLEVVQSLGAGVDHILDTQRLPDQITLARVVDTNLSHDMWEYLLMAVLERIKNIPTYRNDQLNRVWKSKRYKTMAETHVSIMGLGAIGGYAAQKFVDLGFKVSGWSSTKKKLDGVRCYGKDELDLFLAETDILINVLPLTPDTAGILDKVLFSKLRKGAYLVSVGRGAHLVEQDLIEALDSEKLSGAMLDVFEKEPLPESHAFWSHPKIIITPHVASLTNFDSATDLMAENYRRMVSKEPLLHVVSQPRGY